MSLPINSAVPGRRGSAGRADGRVRLSLGVVVATRAVDQELICREDGRAFVIECLRRHEQGDWGDLGDDDSGANDLALTTGARILSSYLIPERVRRGPARGEAGAGADSPGNGSDRRPAIADERLWIITEAEDAPGARPQTTVLFPSDY